MLAEMVGTTRSRGSFFMNQFQKDVNRRSHQFAPFVRQTPLNPANFLVVRADAEDWDQMGLSNLRDVIDISNSVPTQLMPAVTTEEHGEFHAGFLPLFPMGMAGASTPW
jgi:hypothetical protein